MFLINCEINLILTWSTIFIISAATGAIPFRIIDAKHSIALVTLSTQDNVDLLKQLKLGFNQLFN